MNIPDYTPHFAVVGGPSPHPSGDGRMGVCLLASKSLLKCHIDEEVIDHPPWINVFGDGIIKYKTTITVTLDNNVDVGYMYEIIWAPTYKEAWDGLFNMWGDDIVPGNQKHLQDISTRKAIGNGKH